MKRRPVIFVLIGALVVWIVSTYPLVGDVLYRSAMKAEAIVYGFTKKVQKIDDLDIVFYESGAKDSPVILMLHGYSADKKVWLRFARYFAEDYRVVIPDLAGHGETGYSAELDYSVGAQSRRLAHLLDALNIDKAHLIGNSMGGFISADFALRYPERSLSAALVDPGGVSSPLPSEKDKMLASGRNPFLVTSGDEFREFFAMTMASPPWLPGVVLDAMALDYQKRKPQLDHIHEDLMASTPLDDQLAKLEMPVLLLWGKEDKIIHVSSVDVWRSGIDHLEVTVWDDIGHMPMLEIPKASAERYKRFLREHGAL